MKVRKFFRSPFVLVALLFLLSAKGHLQIIDTEYSVRTALSIIEGGTMLIDPVDERIRNRFPDVDGTDKIYSQYGLGLVVILIPVVFFGKVFSFFLGLDQRIVMDFLISFYNVPFALLGLWFFRSILKRLGVSDKRATTTMIWLAITTCYWKYTVTDFSEITQSAFLLGALNAVLCTKHTKWKEVSFWCSLLILMKLIYVLLIPIFLVYALNESRKQSSSSWLFPCLGSICFYLIPVGVLLALANYLRFENPLESGYGKEAASFSLSFFQRDWFDYIFSSDRGILAYNPIILASLPACLTIPKDKRKFFLLLFCICISWYVIMCSWKSWQGGYCWGNRLLVPIVPLLIFPLAFMSLNSLGTKLAFWFLIITSFFIQLAAISTKIHESSVLRDQLFLTTKLSAPNQLVTTVNLFTSKIFQTKPVYKASDFGLKSSEKIDLSKFNSFYGFNFWPVHLFNFLKLHFAIGFVGNFVLFWLLFLAALMFYRNVSTPPFGKII